MYIAMLAHEEQEEIIRALKGWQWVRKNHRSLYDRGTADSYYHRGARPHYGGGHSGPTVFVTDEASVAEYMAGYNDNEQFGDKKDYG